MVIQNIIRYAKALTGFLGFGKTAFGEFFSFHGLMAGIAIGYRYKLYRIAHFGKQDGCAAAILVAIVGVCANHNNADTCIPLCIAGSDIKYEDQEQYG